MEYRADIDGLRAVAVVPVVLFHAGVNSLSGGFVGVDVFFVISGYLITSILLTEAAETGRVSIPAFYFRRVRRIAPALIVVIVASLVAGWLLLFPDQLVALGKSVVASILFVSNIFFWRESGYFRAQGDIVPLLHTWSLSVEEQFYLFAPLVIGLLARNRRAIVASIILIFLASFLLSAVGTHLRPGASFYLLPTRAWELLCGALLAVGIIPAVQSLKWATLLGILGLLMIGGAVIFFDEETVFPGVSAAVPCIGTFLVIYAGQVRNSFATRLLSYRPLVFVGVISYPLYLWHWPIIIYSGQYLGGPLDGAEVFGALLLSFFMSWLTCRYIEKPARGITGRSAANFVKTCFVSAATLAAVAAYFITSDGASWRYSDQIISVAAGSADVSQIAMQCNSDAKFCTLGQEGPTEFVLIGDSHAGALSEAVDIAAREAGKSGLLVHQNSCPPLLGFRPDTGALGDRELCEERNTNQFKAFLRDPNIKTVVIVANWSGYDHTINYSHVHDTLVRILAAGKEAVLLYNLPTPNFDLPWSTATSLARGRSIKPYSYDVEGSLLHGQALPEMARSVPLWRPICEPFDRARVECEPLRDGKPVFSDTNHISRFASVEIFGPFLASQGILHSR